MEETQVQTACEAVRLYQPWPCPCSALNPPASYICAQCNAVSEEVKQAIITRLPYIYKSAQAIEEEKAVLEVDYCGLCGEATLPGGGICEECREGVGEPVDESVLKPTVPEDAIRPWKCENCDTENFSDSNCRSCSMIRKLPSQPHPK